MLDLPLEPIWYKVPAQDIRGRTHKADKAQDQAQDQDQDQIGIHKEC